MTRKSKRRKGHDQVVVTPGGQNAAARQRIASPAGAAAAGGSPSPAWSAAAAAPAAAAAVGASEPDTINPEMIVPAGYAGGSDDEDALCEGMHADDDDNSGSEEEGSESGELGAAGLDDGAAAAAPPASPPAAAAAAAAPALTEATIAKAKVSELRALLVERGLITTGLKAALKDRLRATLTSDDGADTRGAQAGPFTLDRIKAMTMTQLRELEASGALDASTAEGGLVQSLLAAAAEGDEEESAAEGDGDAAARDHRSPPGPLGGPEWPEDVYRYRGRPRSTVKKCATGCTEVPASEEDDRRRKEGFEFFYRGYDDTGADGASKGRVGASEGNLFPESRRGCASGAALKACGLTAAAMLDPLFFLFLVLPLAEHNGLVGFFSDVVMFSNMYAAAAPPHGIGIAGSAFGHKFRTVELPELVKWFGILVVDGAMGGSSGRLHLRWDKSSLLYSKRIADTMSYERFKEIKRVLKLNNNASAPAKGADGYDPASKLRLIYDAMVRNSNALTLYAEADMCVDETSWANGGFGPLNKKIKNKPGVRAGGQAVLGTDASVFRPRVVSFRTPFYERTESKSEGQNEICRIYNDVRRQIIPDASVSAAGAAPHAAGGAAGAPVAATSDALAAAVIGNGAAPHAAGGAAGAPPAATSDALAAAVIGNGTLTPGERKGIYRRELGDVHIVADNYFSGPDTVRYCIDNGMGFLATTSRNKLPVSKKLMHCARLSGNAQYKEARVMRFLEPVVLENME